MAKKVILELNETQARIIQIALEEWFRLRLGQYSDLANGLAFLGYDHKKAKPGEFDRRIQRRDAILEIVKAMLNIAFPCYGTPEGIPSEVHVASDIWSTLRYELSDKRGDGWDRTPFQMGPEPLPKITVENTD